MALQHAELAARYRRRRHHHQTRGVARLGGVIAQPHLAITERPQRERLVVLRPQVPAIDHAWLQHGQRENARAVVDELAHQQVLESLGVVLETQLVDVEQVAATGLGIEDRDDLAPDAVLAQSPLLQGVMTYVDLDAIGGRLALVEALASPERVGLMRHRAGRREVGPPVALLHRHTAGDLVQLLELERPEELVEVEVTVVALGSPRVGTEEVQFRAVRQDDRVALQFDTYGIAREGLDIRLEDVRLGLAGRQEYLVAPGFQRVDQRLAGEVERGTDLPRLENHAGSLIARAVPVFLVVEATVEEGLNQLLGQFLADVVALRLALGTFVTLGKLGVQVGFGTTALVALDPRLALKLPMQQVDFLVVTAGLAVLQDQLNQPGFQGAPDPFYAVGPVPSVAVLP